MIIAIYIIPMTTKQMAIKIARELRKKQSVAEMKFWSYVRGRKFRGYKFQRQFPIFYEYYGRIRFFIADFYCCELHLVVEIDGGIHETQEDYDQIRTEIMEIQKDINVVRFNNIDIVNNFEMIMLNLNQELNLLKSKKS